MVMIVLLENHIAMSNGVRSCERSSAQASMIASVVETSGGDRGRSSPARRRGGGSASGDVGAARRSRPLHPASTFAASSSSSAAAAASANRSAGDIESASLLVDGDARSRIGRFPGCGRCHVVLVAVPRADDVHLGFVEGVAGLSCAVVEALRARLGRSALAHRTAQVRAACSRRRRGGRRRGRSPTVTVGRPVIVDDEAAPLGHVLARADVDALRRGCGGGHNDQSPRRGRVCKFHDATVLREFFELYPPAGLLPGRRRRARDARRGRGDAARVAVGDLGRARRARPGARRPAHPAPARARGPAHPGGAGGRDPRTTPAARRRGAGDERGRDVRGGGRGGVGRLLPHARARGARAVDRRPASAPPAGPRGVRRGRPGPAAAPPARRRARPRRALRPRPLPRLDTERVAANVPYLLVGKDHPQAGATAADLRVLADEPMVLLDLPAVVGPRARSLPGARRDPAHRAPHPVDGDGAGPRRAGARLVGARPGGARPQRDGGPRPARP